MNLFNFLKKKKTIDDNLDVNIDLFDWVKTMEHIAKERYEGKHKAGELDEAKIRKIHCELNGGEEEMKRRNLRQKKRAKLREDKMIYENKIHEHRNLMKQLFYCYKYDVKKPLQDLEGTFDKIKSAIEKNNYLFEHSILLDISVELEEEVKDSLIYKKIIEQGEELLNNFEKHRTVFVYLFVRERVLFVRDKMKKLKTEKGKQNNRLKLTSELDFVKGYMKKIGAQPKFIEGIDDLL